MTREQTIEKLKALYTNAVAAMLRADACDDDESSKVMTEYAETLDSAINALETALQTDGDCISRQAAIEAVLDMNAEHCVSWLDAVVDTLDALPSVQPEPCEDTISRADAIRVASGYCHPANVAEELAKLPSAQPEPKWIPCSERLPEETEARYWVCTDGGYQCQCRWTNDVFGLGEGDTWTWKIFDIPQYSKVIAWMPLPEPYREEGEK